MGQEKTQASVYTTVLESLASSRDYAGSGSHEVEGEHANVHNHASLIWTEIYIILTWEAKNNVFFPKSRIYFKARSILYNITFIRFN